MDRQTRLDVAGSKAQETFNSWTPSKGNTTDPYRNRETAKGRKAAFAFLSALHAAMCGKAIAVNRKLDGMAVTLDAWVKGTIETDIPDDVLYFAQLEMLRIVGNEYVSFDTPGRRRGVSNKDALSQAAMSLDAEYRADSDYSQDNHSNAVMQGEYMRQGYGRMDCRNPIAILIERENASDVLRASAQDIDVDEYEAFRNHYGIA